MHRIPEFQNCYLLYGDRPYGFDGECTSYELLGGKDPRRRVCRDRQLCAEQTVCFPKENVIFSDNHLIKFRRTIHQWILQRFRLNSSGRANITLQQYEEFYDTPYRARRQHVSCTGRPNSYLVKTNQKSKC